MKSFAAGKFVVLALPVLTVVFAGIAPSAHAADILGSASSFAVLAGSEVKNAGSTAIHGNLGVTTDSAITGLSAGNLTNGTIYSADATVAQAQTDLTTAYNALSAMAVTQTLTGTDLGALINPLTSGVYHFASSAQLTGTLVLDAGGDANALFVFQIGSTLTTASASSVQMINGGNAGNVYWQVGSSATLGTNTAFKGSIVALTSITLTTGATIADGRALARNGMVTLDTNQITTPSALETAAPEPGSVALMLSGGIPLVGLVMRRRRLVAIR